MPELHDCLRSRDNIGELFLDEGVVGVHQRLTLNGIDDQQRGAVRQLSVGGEACTARTDNAVFLHD